MKSQFQQNGPAGAILTLTADVGVETPFNDSQGATFGEMLEAARPTVHKSDQARLFNARRQELAAAERQVHLLAARLDRLRAQRRETELATDGEPLAPRLLAIDGEIEATEHELKQQRAQLHAIQPVVARLQSGFNNVLGQAALQAVSQRESVLKDRRRELLAKLDSQTADTLRELATVEHLIDRLCSTNRQVVLVALGQALANDKPAG